MERVHKPHNLSAILRNCDAVGVLEAHAVPGAGGLEVPSGSSAGTSKWVPVRRHSSARSGIEVLRAEGFRVIAAHPEGEARDYREVDFTAPTAILLGAELHGVSEQTLESVDERVVIPMVGMVHSLNVSVAASLLLFEALRQREAAGFYARPRLGPEVYRRLLFEWSHPRLARRLREEGVPYPNLDEDGDLAGS